MKSELKYQSFIQIDELTKEDDIAKKRRGLFGWITSGVALAVVAAGIGTIISFGTNEWCTSVTGISISVSIGFLIALIVILSGIIKKRREHRNHTPERLDKIFIEALLYVVGNKLTEGKGKETRSEDFLLLSDRKKGSQTYKIGLLHAVSFYKVACTND